MKFVIISAAIAALTVGGAVSPVKAAGQPEVSQNAAAAADGKGPAQAEHSKMELKQERDAKKYQNPINQPAPSGSATGNTAMKSTAPGYEPAHEVAGSQGKTSGTESAGKSGKRPPP